MQARWYGVIRIHGYVVVKGRESRGGLREVTNVLSVNEEYHIGIAIYDGRL